MRRHRAAREDRSESPDRWLVSYADFITLLFAFFTILYATSERNAEKTQKFENSVKKYLIKNGGGGTASDKLNQGEKFNSPIEPPIPTYQQDNEKSQDVQKQVETFVEDQLQNEQKSGLVIDISQEELGVRISFAAQKIFSNQSSQFQSGILNAIKKIGIFLANLNKRLLIEGHATADNLPPAGFASPWELAGLRATTFVRYLIKVHHFAAENLLAVSRGAEKPLLPAKDKGAKNKNNRLDVLILNDDAPL